MGPIIKVPKFTDKKVTFKLENLQTVKKNFYTILDVSTGRQVAYGDVPAGAAQTLDVSTKLVGANPGVYELRLYNDDTFSQTKQRPVEGAAPDAAHTFQLLSAQPAARVNPPEGRLVRLERSATDPTNDSVLWDLVQAWTTARQFNVYREFIDQTVCRSGTVNIFGPTAYEDLAKQTRAFLAATPSLVDQQQLLAKYTDGANLPYIAGVIDRYPDAVSGDPCSDIGINLLEPFPVELIWSYWHEEGALVQTLNHILARFQNRRPHRNADPLARFDLNPLRPLRHILWQWAEDEESRLTIRRRAAEYEYEYGLALVGRAIPGSHLWVERRTKFLEAFHTLLFVCHQFFQQDDDTTVQSDAFPVLNALRETHLVLSEGAHNQFGDLPTEARVQMLVMQWLLAQPEMRDFLGGRPMVPYEEPWMDRVDTMKTIQGWTDTSVTHFRDLGVFGEQLLLSIRYGNWNSIIVPDSAKNWARKWRAQIQRYVHAYRAATGVDLSASPDARMPAGLLARRTANQRQRA